MGIIDLLLLAIVAVVTWCVASEGAWGAGITFLCVVFAGLLAMNFFEPLAEALERNSPGWGPRWDFIALVGLFTGFVFGLRFLTDRLAPTFMNVHPLAYEVGRWALGFGTGWVTMAVLLTALHTAPLPRTVTATSVSEFLGFEAERGNFFGVAPDRQWLGFTQYVSRRSMPNGRVFDGPYFRTGDFEGYWPSFPIRYATRREQLASGGVSAAPPPSDLRLRQPGQPRRAGGAAF